jgi:hypothetical protein
MHNETEQRQEVCEKILQRKNRLVNHLWWLSVTCGGDTDGLVEKLTSVSNHV